MCYFDSIIYMNDSFEQKKDIFRMILKRNKILKKHTEERKYGIENESPRCCHRFHSDLVSLFNFE